VHLIVYLLEIKKGFSFLNPFVVLVGVARFELATSCSQSRRDDRATLHPDWCFIKRLQI